MLGMLAAIPGPAVLALHAQQAASALATFVDFLFSARRLNNPIDRILHKFGDKGRRAGIRCEDGQGVPRPRHRNIHHAPFLCILERLLIRRDQSKQRIIDNLRWETYPPAVGVQQNHMIRL